MTPGDGGGHGTAAGKVDQFESVFRSAAKTRYQHADVDIGSVLVVSDRSESEASAFGEAARSFLGVLERGENVRWRVVHGGDFNSVPELLELVEAERPGLICTYRHLHSASWQWPYTLGEYVDVLTQATSTPVLVMPHPERGVEGRAGGTDVVIAMTDAMVGDDRLVRWASRFTDSGGRLVLAHVEDDRALDRILDAIGKIPSIDTARAREHIVERLVRDAGDYMESCRAALARAELPITVETVIEWGHHLTEFRTLIDESEADLLVMNTKDEDQLAMHGLAYPLAIEVRSIPLLLL